MQEAVIYRVNGRMLVGAILETSEGIAIEKYPLMLKAHTDLELAEAIRGALETSGMIVPHPRNEDWLRLFQPFLAAAGVRSLKAFMRDAASVTVRRDSGAIEIMPTRNMGPREGFHGLPDAMISVPDDDLVLAAREILAFLDKAGAQSSGNAENKEARGSGLPT